VEHDRKAGTAIIRREQVDYEGKPLFKYEERKVHPYDDQFNLGTPFPADPRRSFLAVLEEREDNQRLTWFKQFIGNLWILHLSPALMTSISKKETPWLERDGKNLASWYRVWSAEYPEAVDALRADMREVIDGLQFFRLVSAGDTAKLFAVLGKGADDTRK